MDIDFRTLELPNPQYADVAAEIAEIGRTIDLARSGPEVIAATRQWDRLRRRITTWNELVGIRFAQDTRNPAYQAMRTYRDELTPQLTNLAIGIKRQLLNSPYCSAIASEFGAHVLQLWKCDIAAFDPAIEGDLVEQSKLEASYTALLASAKFQFRDETLTLSQMSKFDEHPEREVRHAAATLRWQWFGQNREQLDDIFDQMVHLRDGMARKLHYDTFIPLGYQLLRRVDYTAADVEQFRNQVRDLVVPLVRQIRAKQAAQLQLDPLMAWDEGIYDLRGNPRPAGDHDWMIARATEMFRELGEGMDTLFDLASREGKGGGGFCSGLPDLGMPFIFANFNGTMHDVRVFTHEMGHALQCYESRDQPLEDYLWPTMEACEIHSMGLEFLSWPQMRLFFGEDVGRFRKLHLTQMLTFLPYGVAIDHFQHLVYGHPQATVDDRADMWRDMERLYLPTLKWGDLAHPASGRRWQAQMHLFACPFYYIDYTLALACALQFWVQAAENRADVLQRYIQLCRRGGSAPFGDLVQGAGLTSPFTPGCLEQVVAYAHQQWQCD